MYEPCALIQDLLPPLAGTAFAAMRAGKAVEGPFKGLPRLPGSPCGNGSGNPAAPRRPREADERQKAASFESVRRRFRLRTALAAGGGGGLPAPLRLRGAPPPSKQAEKTVEYTGNLSVSMEPEGLVGYLEGSDYCHLEVKRVGDAGRGLALL